MLVCKSSCSRTSSAWPPRCSRRTLAARTCCCRRTQSSGACSALRACLRGASKATLPSACWSENTCALHASAQLASRGLAFRAVGDAHAALNSPDWAAVARITRDFVGMAETHRWEPTLASQADGLMDYAPYRLSHLAAAGATLTPFDSISAAMEAY